MSVAPVRENKGIDAGKGQLDAPAVYVLTHLDTMLDRGTVYATDAHFVPYIVHDQTGALAVQPRVNKGGLELMRERGCEVKLFVLVADVDNLGHAKWTSHEEALAAVDRVAKLVPTAAVYATSGGMRIVQPMTKALSPEEYESAHACWLAELLRRGIQADAACSDWTRHYRAPHVRRDGKAYVSPAVVRSCQEVAPPAGMAIARRARKASGKMVELAFVGDLPAELERAADRLAAVVAPLSMDLSWHALALKLSGLLCRKGVRAEYVPTMIGRILAGDLEMDDRLTVARDTCRRYMSRLPIDSDVSEFAGVGLVVEELFGGFSYEREDEPTESIEVVSAKMLETIRTASDGVTLIKAQCGLGKTHALRAIAKQRAEQAKKLGSKTAISVPTTKLAEQVQRDLEAAGVPCLRMFGPLSMPGPHKGKECKYATVGAALARGGLSVAAVLCRGCDQRDTCRAKDGIDGPADARVAVGPHALVAELAEHAGKTGLLGVDEPPPLLTVETLTVDDVRRALGELHFFESTYAACMAPILDGVRRWIERGLDVESGSILRGLTVIDPALEEAAFETTGCATALEWAEASMGTRKGDAPPVKDDARTQLRLDIRSARSAGDAAYVLSLIRRAVLSHEDVSASVEDLPGKDGAIRKLVLVASEKRMQRALRREGATVVVAADADVSKSLVARTVGYDPPMAAFRAAEVPVQRTLIRTAGANRKGWIGSDGLQSGSILRAIRSLVDWFLEGEIFRTCAVVTYLSIETEIREQKTEFALAAGQEFSRLRHGVALGHYGALRGLDEWKDLDALGTLGDPIPNIGVLERQAAWVRRGRVAVLPPDDWARRHAAAELEQAHGRLRTVHRGRPCRQAHVGTVLPAGWGSRVRIVEAHDGRPRGVEVEQIAEVIKFLGGASLVSRQLGVSRSTVNRWISKESRPPTEAVKAMMALVSASGESLAQGVPERAIKGTLNSPYWDTPCQDEDSSLLLEGVS